ncbi:MAG TPA: SH3 domain-containing protein, partial [bacterium]|nr:SH3 domain-containing protein [bacterium]
VSYWMRSRPNSVVFGDNNEVNFEYFLDYRGNVYDAQGNMVTDAKSIQALGEKTTGGYLGFDTATPGLTTEARETFLRIFSSVEKATILETGTGWLRVRSTPSLTGEEIARVNVGQAYTVVEKQAGWVKIQVAGEQTGWVSADFVRVE